MTKNIIISMMACLILGITACQKDDNKITKSASISQEDLDLSKKITAFIDKINNPSTLKSGELINVDDALWNLEAAMNYSFADIPEQFSDTQLDSIEFVLHVDNEFCTESSLNNLYQSMYASIQDYCNALNGYQFLTANVTTANKTAGAVTVKAYLAIVKPWIDPRTVFGPDDWWHSFFGGYCDGPYVGQALNRHSSKEIQSKVNASIPPLAHISGCPVYFTDIKEVWVPDIPNPNWDSIAFPYRKLLTRYYFTFYTPYYPDYPDNCLSPDDLNFFTNNIRNIINSSTMKPAGKTLLSVTGAGALRCMIYYPWDEYHLCLRAIYGIPHVTPCGPEI